MITVAVVPNQTATLLTKDDLYWRLNSMGKVSLDQHLDRLLHAGSWQRIHHEMLDNIRTRRFHLTTVDTEGVEPTPVYSVGLWHHFNHPEIVTFGLPEQVAKDLITDMIYLIKMGQPPAMSTPLGQVNGHYPVRLEPVTDRNLVHTHLPMAVWFYEGDTFPVLQLFWSDPNGQKKAGESVS